MPLQNAHTLLEKYRQQNALGSYALLVSSDAGRQVITSEDVNEVTYFDIASMGKVLVTSTLILQAIGEGRLSLTDTLQTFFDFVSRDKKDITVLELLTHSSGILRNASVITTEVVKKGKDAIAGAILSQPLGYAPGSQVVYSCSGYVLLGFIVEKVFGAPLDQVFYQRLHRPLGLVRTDFNIPIDCPNAVHSYTRPQVGECRVDDTIAYRMQGVAGNGASFWCLRDIETFVHSALQHTLFAPHLSPIAEADHTPGLGAARGLGYQIVDDTYSQTGRLFPVGSFGHCGHTGTSFFIHRKSGLYVILLTNATRHHKLRNHWQGYDYNEVIHLRENVHNAILTDLTAPHNPCNL